MRARENFSLVDTAWLHMDVPTSMAVIVGVIMFEEPLAFPTLKKLVAERLLRVPRFRHRSANLFSVSVCRSGKLIVYFNIDAHLHRIALPAPHDQSALHDLVSDLMSTPLDFNKPLWQFHLVEQYGDGCALICRLHHSMADGLALVQVLLSMADNPPEGISEIPEPRTTGNRRQPRAGLVNQALKPGAEGNQVRKRVG